MDCLYDEELRQLRQALEETHPPEGSDDATTLDAFAWNPNTDRAAVVARWVERAAERLPAGHPLRFRRDDEPGRKPGEPR